MTAASTFVDRTCVYVRVHLSVVYVHMYVRMCLLSFLNPRSWWYSAPWNRHNGRLQCCYSCSRGGGSQASNIFGVRWLDSMGLGQPDARQDVAGIQCQVRFQITRAIHAYVRMCLRTYVLHSRVQIDFMVSESICLGSRWLRTYVRTSQTAYVCLDPQLHWWTYIRGSCMLRAESDVLYTYVSLRSFSSEFIHAFGISIYVRMRFNFPILYFCKAVSGKASIYNSCSWCPKMFFNVPIQ